MSKIKYVLQYFFFFYSLSFFRFFEFVSFDWIKSLPMATEFQSQVIPLEDHSVLLMRNSYSTSSCFFSSYFILTVYWNITNYTLKHNLLVESSDVIRWPLVGKFTGGDSETLCPNNRTFLVFFHFYYVSVSFRQDFTFFFLCSPGIAG